ncbi:MAG: ribosome assembly cofactor RimP [Cyclobacteriaceae bacterium]
MSVQLRVEQAVKDKLEQIGDDSLFLVDVMISQSKNSQKVVVHLDGDQGVSIDTCAELSRHLSAILDEEDLLEGSFTLEVSSPGLDQPLKMERQYKKNIGRRVKILTTDDRTLKGVLAGVAEQHVILKEETKVKGKHRKPELEQEAEIPFEQIKKINVLASFN